jgi:hypothetical protein
LNGLPLAPPLVTREIDLQARTFSRKAVEIVLGRREVSLRNRAR